MRDSAILGKFDPSSVVRSSGHCPEELKAAHEMIDELKASLSEMVGIYWGEGDGIEPAPMCIQRAWEALGEEVR